MMGTSYQQAKAALDQVMKAKVYQPKPIVTPWWIRALDWLLRHLHISVTKTDWVLVTWFVSGLLLIVAVAAFSLWGKNIWLGGRYQVRGLMTPHHQPENYLGEAEAAYHQQDYPAMIRQLLDFFLLTVARRSWVKLAVYKTMRTYQMELRRTGPLDFIDLFQLLSDRAEHVLYAGQSISNTEAEELLIRVRAVVTPE
jgi:hypothetical protein